MSVSASEAIRNVGVKSGWIGPLGHARAPHVASRMASCPSADAECIVMTIGWTEQSFEYTVKIPFNSMVTLRVFDQNMHDTINETKSQGWDGKNR